jgi:hypothetical protein
MKLTGHKTEAVYRRYAIAAESDVREAGVKLAAALGTGLATGSLSCAYGSSVQVWGLQSRGAGPREGGARRRRVLELPTLSEATSRMSTLPA